MSGFYAVFLITTCLIYDLAVVMKKKMWRSGRFSSVGKQLSIMSYCVCCMAVVWKIPTRAGCGGCEQPVEATHSLQSGLLFSDYLSFA